MVMRNDPEKHKAQVRAANRARYRAVQRLIGENQTRFDTLYADEASREGVDPKPRGRINAAALQLQISELTRRLDQIKQPDPA